MVKFVIVRHGYSIYNKARKFTGQLDIPLDEVNCLGCQSNNVFKLCKDCPFTKCASERKIAECSECVEYPCNALAEYQEKYVNKCNQVTRDCGNGINE